MGLDVNQTRRKFYNRAVKPWMHDNHIKMYPAHNKWKSVVAERFITVLKNKICKHMTAVSKNVCIDKLDEIIQMQQHM